MIAAATLHADVGSNVRIRPDAVTPAHDRHPYAGKCGIVTGKRRGGTLEIEAHGKSLLLDTGMVDVLGDGEMAVDLPPAPMPGKAAPAEHAAAAPAPVAPQPAGDAEFQVLALGAIVRSPTNPRTHFDPAKLEELASSIRASGVHQPILVRPLPAARLEDTFHDRTPGQVLPTHEIVAGERRYRASRLAGRETIPAIVRALSDEQVLEVQLVENLQRDDLHPMEEAEGYERLMAATSVRAEDLGAKIGRSRAYVYARLNLLKLTAAARTAFVAGEVDFSRALLISRIPDAELQKKALKTATEKDYNGELLRSYRQFEDYVHRELMLPLDKARFKITQIDLVPDAGSCRDCPKRTGANPDLFSDVKSADVCTDPRCYHAKEDAHDAAQLATAKASGKKVIAGKAAKEIWPSPYREELEGYIRLDKPDTRTGTKKAVKSLLGKDAPESIVLVSPHDGKAVEVLPRDTVNKILKDKGHLTPAMARLKRQPSEHEVKAKLRDQYQRTWRTRAVEAIWQAMQDPPAYGLGEAVVRLIAKGMVGRMRQDERALIARLLGLGKVATHDGIRAHLDDAEACDGHCAEHVLMLLLCMEDLQSWYDYQAADNVAEATHILAVAADFEVDTAAIQQAVKTEMEEEARPKPAAEQPAGPKAPAKGKTGAAGARKKTSKTEAAASIAEALQAAEQVATPAAAEPEDAGGEAVDLARPRLKPTGGRAVPKYRCKMTGSTWSGRGKQPVWVRLQLEAGKTLQELEHQPGKENAEGTEDDQAGGDVEAAPVAAQLTPAWPFPKPSPKEYSV